MTNEHDPESAGNAGEDAGENADVSDITPLDPQTEALVTNTLATLPTLTMPEDVHQRLLAAIAAEPNPYAASAGSAPEATAVTALPAQRSHRSGWYLGIAGVAAASVLGLVVGTSVLDGDTGPTTAPITAAAIPMTASTKQYQKENFSAQVAASLPAWRTSAAKSAATADVEATSIATPSQTSQPTASPTETLRALSVDKRLREQVAACLSKVSSRAPMYVEIASYRSNPATPAEQIAVAAVDGENKSVDVYAIGVACNDGDPQLVREHVTLNSQ